MDDIAATAGIGRRTFFRYFASKNDLPWGDFDGLLSQMRTHLHESPADAHISDSIRDAVLRFNELPDAEIPYHRQRMTLLLRVPTLQAHSMLRYASWRNAIAEFVAERLGKSTNDLAPRAMGWSALAAAMSAYEQWLNDDGADLQTLLRRTLSLLPRTFPSDP